MVLKGPVPNDIADKKSSISLLLRLKLTFLIAS